MARRERRILVVWLATTIIVLCSCLFAYRGEADAAGLAAESFAIVISILAFPTAIAFGLLIAAATYIPVVAQSFLNTHATMRLGLDWVVGFAAGYVQYIIIPALRKHWRKQRAQSLGSA